MESEKKIIQFGHFDVSKLMDSSSVLVIGKSSVGKTTLVTDIMNNVKDKFANLNNGSIIAPADKHVGLYDKFPQSSIHYKYDSDVPANVIKNQFNLICSNNNNKNGYFIMDNCDSKNKLWSNDPNVETILLEGSEYNLTYILTTAHPLTVKKEHRQHFDYIFLFGAGNIEYKRNLYENYAIFFGSFELFDQIFDKMTRDYGCMVINNLEKSKDITICVNWYKAVDKIVLENSCLSDSCDSLKNLTLADDLKNNVDDLKNDIDEAKSQLEEKNKYIDELEYNLKSNSESLNNIREEFCEIESNNLQLWKGFQHHRKCNILLLQALSIVPVACTTLTYLSIVGYF